MLALVLSPCPTFTHEVKGLLQAPNEAISLFISIIHEAVVDPEKLKKVQNQLKGRGHEYWINDRCGHEC